MKYIAPVKYIQSLSPNTQSHLLFLIARNVEMQLNERADVPYARKEINASFIAELLCITKQEPEPEAEDDDVE